MTEQVTDKVNSDVSHEAKRPTILVMAGGTGGHIFPGIAVAEELVKKGWKVHWLGTAERMEAEIVPKNGYPISFINIAGIRNKNWQTWLKTPFKILQSVMQSIRVLREVKPDVVLGMGGYASAPGGVAAWLLRIPLVLHEQNAVAGMSNRFLSHFARKTLSAFPGAFSERVTPNVVGNPLRSDIIAIENVIPEQPATSKKVLVVGGSLGAKVLNDVVPQAMKQIKVQSIDVWHQTGGGNEQAVLNSYQDFGLPEDKVKVTEFIDDMASAYQWADIVICRAGALTVSELAMASTPAIFVPLPHAVDDHQTKNAQYLVACGGAILIKQHELTSEQLTKQLLALVSQPQVLKNMAQAAFAAADVDATRKVANICQQLAA